MKRSIKSDQRQVKIISIIVSADGLTTTGIDKNKVTVADTGTGIKTITMDAPLSADYSVVCTTATADSVAQIAITSSTVFVVNTFDSTDGTTAKDAICHIIVIGSEVAARY
jgi:MinD-like ATPase involved in chromosome partitioning or flagellar assembly